MGRDHLVVARLPDAVQHASAPRADCRLRSEPCVFRGWLVHVPIGAVSSRQFWNAAVEDGIETTRSWLGAGRRRERHLDRSAGPSSTEKREAEKEGRQESKSEGGGGSQNKKVPIHRNSG